jgi:acyl carrier protein
MSQQTTADRAQLLERVRSYLHEHLEIEPSAVDEGTRFRDDLDIDSLDMAAMALAIETEYGIRLDDEAILRIETVGDACDLVLSDAATSTH